MTNDPTKDTATDKDSALARQAKGSVQEAIGELSRHQAQDQPKQPR